MCADCGAIPFLTPLDYECYQAKDNSCYHHRVEPYDAAQHEFSGSHPFAPAVVIGIPYDKSRQCKKEINGKITMVEILVNRTGGKRLEHVVPYY